MNIKQTKKIYLKNIYFNCGKSVMDSCFLYMKNYIDYKQLNIIFNHIKHSPASYNTVLYDCFGAFATTLCSRLENELFYNETVIKVFDPYFNKKVICQLIIPNKNISISNTINEISHCKVFNLYSKISLKNSFYNLMIAIDFFKEANKYN